MYWLINITFSLICIKNKCTLLEKMLSSSIFLSESISHTTFSVPCFVRNWYRGSTLALKSNCLDLSTLFDLLPSSPFVIYFTF